MNIGTLTGEIAIEDQLSGVLTQISARVKKFASGFDDALGTIVVSSALAAAALTAVTAAVISLGVRGSEVNNLSNTLERFTGNAQQAEKVMDAMRRGTLGVVSNFDLMTSSTKLLAAGVKLSAENFGTMSKAATVLNSQGLGPTKNMLDLVSQAMLTGRTRSLEMAIGKIDLSKAEDNYAKTLGVSKKQLTDVQQIEAKRIGILEALDKRVQAAGTQQRNFGDQIQFVGVQIKNWFDQLSGAVAKSPQVMEAMNRIGKAITDAFGGSGQAAIEKIVGWVNKFADVVRVYGPVVIEWTRDVYDGIVHYGGIIAKWLGVFIDKVMEVYRAVKIAWDATPQWLKDTAQQAALAGGAIYLLGGTAKAATSSVMDTVGNIATTISGVGDATRLFGGRLKDAAGAVKDWYKNAEMLGTFRFTGLISDWIFAIKEYIGVTTVATGATAKLGLAMKSIGIVAIAGALFTVTKNLVDYANATNDSDRASIALDNTLMKMLPEFITHREAIKSYVDVALDASKKAADQIEKDSARMRAEVAKNNAALSGPLLYSSPNVHRGADGFGFSMTGMEGLAKSMSGARIEAEKTAPAVDLAAEAIKNLADQLSGRALAEQVRQLDRAFMGLDPSARAAAISSGRLGSAIRTLHDAGAKLTPWMKEMVNVKPGKTWWDHLQEAANRYREEQEALLDFEQARWNKWRNEQERLADQHDDMVERMIAMDKERARSGDSDLQQQLNAIDDWLEAQLSAFDVSVDGYQGWADKVTEEAERARRAVMATVNGDVSGLGKGITWSRSEAEVERHFEIFGKKAGVSFVGALGDAVSSIGDVIQRAIEGGGNVLLAVMSHMGNTAGKFFMAKFAEGAREGESAGMTSLLSGIAGFAIGTMGSIISDILKPSFTAMEILAKQFGKSVEVVTEQLKAMGDAGAKAYRDIEEASFFSLEGIKRFNSGMRDARDMFGLLSQFQTKEELQRVADQWKDVYDYMLSSGLYTAAQLAEAWKKYQAALEAAVGAVEPEDTRPIRARSYLTSAELKKIAQEYKEAYDYMVASGLYTAETLGEAWDDYQDALIASGDKTAKRLKEINDEIAKLQDAIAAEPPEFDAEGNRIYGVEEWNNIQRLAALEKEKFEAGLVMVEEQNQAQKAAAELAEDQAQKAFDKAKLHAINLDDHLRKLFSKGYDIPIRFTGVPGTPNGFMGGPGANIPTPRVDTREMAWTGASQRSGGGGTAIIEIDKQKFASVMVPANAKETIRRRLR